MSTRYLFKRKGSDNWYIRLQRPGQNPTERSLGTTDEKAAELAAAEAVNAHKAFMYHRRAARVASVVHGPWAHEYEPGLHTLPDGRQVMATATDLTFSDGTRRPNGGPAIGIVGPRLSPQREFKAFDDAHAGRIGVGPVDIERPRLVAKSADDAILETYIKHKNITGYREREARAVWHTFRRVVNKPLRDCTRDDGRAVVAYLEDQSDEPLKSATLRRKMVPLVAAVAFAINEAKLKFNPFSGVVPDRKDEDERDAFNDDDMKLIRDSLDKLDPNDQLLLRVVATTGIDRSEAFSIASEQTEDGIRYCTVGTKTGHRPRRIPFPKDLLPHLPAKITKPLITGRKDSASKRLRKFLKSIGVINDHDGRHLAPNHSFRHRAKNRLRRSVPDDELRVAIGGWTDGKKNSGRKYGNKHGKGYPIKVLRKAIDTIGMM